MILGIVLSSTGTTNHARPNRQALPEIRLVFRSARRLQGLFERHEFRPLFVVDSGEPASGEEPKFLF
jgi:hypothetical protein